MFNRIRVQQEAFVEGRQGIAVAKRGHPVTAEIPTVAGTRNLNTSKFKNSNCLGAIRTTFTPVVIALLGILALDEAFQFRVTQDALIVLTTDCR